MKIIFFVVIFLLAIWFVRGYVVSRVEKPKTELIKSFGSVEIRKTPEKIYASVTVQASQEQAPTQAFRILAGFIFGNNTSKTKVAMTAPVISQEVSETIAMTAPVLSQKSGTGTYEVSFIMPASYTLETLPVPNDTRIRIHTVAEKTIAVITFDGYATVNRVARYRAELIEAIQKNALISSGEILVAQYNDPWTPWFMRTNEIWLEVNDKF